MSWIIWIVLGLIAGIIAKFIMPGRDPGGFISTKLGFGDVTGFNIASIVIAVLGSMLLLLIYRMVKR